MIKGMQSVMSRGPISIMLISRVYTFWEKKIKSDILNVAVFCLDYSLKPAIQTVRLF